MSLTFEGFEIARRRTTPCEAPQANYGGVQRSVTVIKKGFQKNPETRPFTCSVIFDRDLEIPLRDGVKLRADVFRPVDGPKVPALICWSPYGKSGAGFLSLNLVPGRVGVAKSAVSGFENFEGLDPAEWVGRGYAVVNVDTRGAFDSEGDVRWFGSDEGKDGYDAIEYIAQQAWCNGHTALAGNSWLAMTQWIIAAAKPPHLTCIAPWEGASDFYRETLCRGGIPYKPFWDFIAQVLFGRHEQEDVIAMLEKYPYMNEYWADKRAKIEEIEVPAYILASYSTGIHTAGSFRGYEGIRHNKKWLRVHTTQEWHDLYQPANVEDLAAFFGHYTKQEQNNWEQTPNIRLSILGFNSKPLENQVFPAWPIPSTTYHNFFLAPGNRLSETPTLSATSSSYQSDVPALQIDDDDEELLFSYIFSRKSYFVGYAKVVLHMSCSDHNDLDVFVQLRKANQDGKILQNFNIPLKDMVGVTDEADVMTLNTNKYLGPNGCLRASHRAIDHALSSEHSITYSHDEASVTTSKVAPGDIVRLEIALWPAGILFEAGEQLVLKVAGHPLVLAEFEPLRGAFVADNQGRHIVHFGGDYDSKVVIPLVQL